MSTDILNADPLYGSDASASWFDRPFFREASYVAMIYADSLRDNFIAAGLENNAPKLAELETLKQTFNDETSRARPRLDVLLKIEAHLIHILPPAVTKTRFWSILDRFERVVPSLTRAQYAANVPPKGDPIWEDENFIVQQARTLLDVIHANYMINLGREKSTRRLKMILLSVFGAATMLTLILSAIDGEMAYVGYGVLAYAGILGAIMSVIQRLQSAVSHDAMTTDGVFELIGLRLGWTGILMSVLSGGVFALVLYYIVMAGLFTAAVPASAMDGPAISAQQSGNRLKAELSVLEKTLKRKEEKRAELAAPTSTSTQSDSASAPQADRTKLEDEIEALQVRIDEITANQEFLQDEGLILAPETDKPPAKTGDQAPTPDEKAPRGTEMAQALGLADGASFFKMLILSFLAGFAERMVPDILERLRKTMAAS